MKRTLLFVLIFLPLLPLAVNAAVEIDGINYNLDSDAKTAEVTYQSNSAYSGAVVIPSSVTHEGVDYIVTSIKDHAFYGCTRMTSVTIPQTVTSIGQLAFGGCDLMKAVYISDIEAWLQIDFGSSDANPLAYAHRLFLNGEEIKDFVVPNGVTSIKALVFNGYSSMNSITIPASLTSIGQWAFQGCSGLTAVHISDLEAWCKISFTNPSNPLQFAHRLFLNGEEIKHLIIPDGMTAVSERTFQGCSSLLSVSIPNSVTSIGESAFSGCSSITSVTIPESVTSIGGWAFSGCSSLEMVTLSNNVSKIGRRAFANCTSLTSITIPDNVETIEDETFYFCGLNTATIPDGVSTIGEKVFQGCSSLTSVTIPGTVTSIGDEAFKDCIGLTAVHISDLEAWCKIDFDVFNGYSNPLLYAHHLYLDGEEIKDLVIPSSVTSIGNLAFCSCSGLTSVTIPGSVKSIGDDIHGNVFSGCTGLTSVMILDGVTSIGPFTFRNCSSLTKVTIPNSVARIGEDAFNSCVALKSITIPNDVTTIGGFTFSGCSNLTTVFIGSGVNSIAFKAFQGCMSLTDLYCYSETVPTMGDAVFWNSSVRSATLHVPAGSIDAYNNAGQWRDFKSIVALPTQDDYRPFVEDDKVWKVGGIGSNPVQLVEYYYFDGDTIIGGKTCKQMMRQRYVNAEHPDYAIISLYPLLSYVGAWYEEDKKVYAYDSINNQFLIKYDFSLNANDTILIDNYLRCVVGPRQTGGIKGFKGVHRDVMKSNIYNTTWLEGVGGIDGPTRNVYYGKEGHPLFLMSCVVGDEVLYNNEDFEDGATPEGARKGRFDFTHTIKTKPQTPNRREAEPSIYGEYSDKLLAINLNPLGDAYMVRITDETGTAVYEKAINAGTIVGLNIDISSYTRGRYVVTVENNHESFTGEFEVQTSGIENHVANETPQGDSIYNLQGQRIATLQKGLNIVNGKKVYNRN